MSDLETEISTQVPPDQLQTVETQEKTELQSEVDVPTEQNSVAKKKKKKNKKKKNDKLPEDTAAEV